MDDSLTAQSKQLNLFAALASSLVDSILYSEESFARRGKSALLELNQTKAELLLLQDQVTEQLPLLAPQSRQIAEILKSIDRVILQIETYLQKHT